LPVAKVAMVVNARFEVLAEELMKNQASWEKKPPKDFGFLVFNTNV